MTDANKAIVTDFLSDLSSDYNKDGAWIELRGNFGFTVYIDGQVLTFKFDSAESQFENKTQVK